MRSSVYNSNSIYIVQVPGFGISIFRKSNIMKCLTEIVISAAAIATNLSFNAVSAGFFPFLILIYFVPASSDGLKDDRSKLYESLRHVLFADATLISVGISITLSFHMSLETLASFRSRKSKSHLFTRWINLIAYAITNCVIWITLRTDSINGRIYFILEFLMCSVFTFGHVGALVVLCPDVWTIRRGFAISSLVSLFFALTYHDQYFLNFDSVCGALAFSCYIIVAILLLSTCRLWYKKYLQKRTLVEFGTNEKISAARMCSLVMALFGIAAVFIFYGKCRLADISVTFITTFSYFVSANAIGYTMSYLKKMHYEAAEVTVCKISLVYSVWDTY